ncbi:MAG TPA: hypothetical protein DCQ83_02655 [Fibrobacteres bacterium]|jgi:decaprenylphospho-beta-D-ribofuranose 2-oxidase|nr:hypothetical protein [Fibrobacterota bacterium]
MPSKRTISGWGRYPVIEAREEFPAGRETLSPKLNAPYLPRGQGRSYGDAGLPASDHTALNTSYLDRFISFDPVTGILEAEGGVTLERILRFSLPRGFFLPVTPGTMFVSLGGALASNVHGKNHHRCGSIEHFVTEFEIGTPSGTFTCSRESNRELFLATLGGYGLTGTITRANLKLKPVTSIQVDCLRIRAKNLEAMFRLFEEHDTNFEYSVAWMDALAKGGNRGRGILMLGNHSDMPVTGNRSREKTKLRVPFPMPGMLMNNASLKVFNTAIYLFSRHGKSRENFESFFYPLDRILDWNLLYGKQGFLQYQCVIPDPHGQQGIESCLRFLSDNGLGSFVSVLKRCGDDEVMLPFCKRGYTLALDIPFHGTKTLRALDRLDALVIDYGGRVYLTKDARLKPEAFRAMYPEYKTWMDTIRHFNPEGKISSRLAERLKLWDA